jgi:hypothetical protein
MSCTPLFVYMYMLTCKHSEVCILKTHVNMLAYEIEMLLLKLIKFLSQSILYLFYMEAQLGVGVRYFFYRA